MSEIAGELARVRSAFAQPTLTLLHQRRAPVVITIFRAAFGRNNKPIATARLHTQWEDHLAQIRLAGETDVPNGSGREICHRWMRGQWLVRSLGRGRPRGLLADLPRAAGARAGQEPRPRPGHPQRAPDRHDPRHRAPVQRRGQPGPHGPGDDPQRRDRPAAGGARPAGRGRRDRQRDRGLHARGLHRAALTDLGTAERLRPRRGAVRHHPQRDPGRLPCRGPTGRRGHRRLPRTRRRAGDGHARGPRVRGRLRPAPRRRPR
nr:DUF3375 domain-containing protein [Nocardioides sp. B-3]